MYHYLPTLKPSLKQKLLSASAKALKVCCRINDYMISFVTIHSLCNGATPNQMLQYKLALCLFKLYNNVDYNPIEFLSLNSNQVLTSCQTTFKILKNNRTKVGLNGLSNRFHSLNNTIPLEWLNLTIESFKEKCKASCDHMILFS